MIILTGNSNYEFANIVARRLFTSLGECRIVKFSNGETRIDEITDSLRGEDIYIIYSSGSNINDEILEILLLAHTIHYASAKSITLVVPCFPYARQDRKTKSRDAISSRFFMDMCETVKINHIITIDLHNAAIQGFASFPTDNLSAISIFTSYIYNNLMPYYYDTENISPEDFVIVSPDAGGMKRARDLANRLHLESVIIYKERDTSSNISTMKLLGNVENKFTIIVDDMSDTCGTLRKASKLLKDSGATHVYSMVTHGILSGNAIRNINDSCLDKVIVTNSVNLYNKQDESDKIEVLDITPLVSASILRHSNNESMAPLFNYDETQLVNMLESKIKT